MTKGKRVSVQVPVKVRRWVSEEKWNGARQDTRIHAGKYYTVTSVHGFNLCFWAGVCLTEKRLEKIRTDILGRYPRGRALTAGAKAPITCPRCADLLGRTA